MRLSQSKTQLQKSLICHEHICNQHRQLQLQSRARYSEQLIQHAVASPQLKGNLNADGSHYLPNDRIILRFPYYNQHFPRLEWLKGWPEDDINLEKTKSSAKLWFVLQNFKISRKSFYLHFYRDCQLVFPSVHFLNLWVSKRGCHNTESFIASPSDPSHNFRIAFQQKLLRKARKHKVDYEIVCQLFNNPPALDLLKILRNKFHVNNELCCCCWCRGRRKVSDAVTFLMSIYIFLPNDQQHSYNCINLQNFFFGNLFAFLTT